MWNLKSEQKALAREKQGGPSWWPADLWFGLLSLGLYALTPHGADPTGTSMSTYCWNGSLGEAEAFAHCTLFLETLLLYSPSTPGLNKFW